MLMNSFCKLLIQLPINYNNKIKKKDLQFNLFNFVYSLSICFRGTTCNSLKIKAFHYGQNKTEFHSF